MVFTAGFCSSPVWAQENTVDYTLTDASGRDFSNQDLSGTSFAGAEVRDANFENADLRTTNIKHIDLNTISPLQGAFISKEQASDLLSGFGLKVI